MKIVKFIFLVTALIFIFTSCMVKHEENIERMVVEGEILYSELDFLDYIDQIEYEIEAIRVHEYFIRVDNDGIVKSFSIVVYKPYEDASRIYYNSGNDEIQIIPLDDDTILVEDIWENTSLLTYKFYPETDLTYDIKLLRPEEVFINPQNTETFINGIKVDGDNLTYNGYVFHISYGNRNETHIVSE